MAKYGSVASEPEHPDFEKGEGGEQRGQKIDFNMGETYYLKEDGSKWRRKLLLAMPTIVIFILLMGGFAFFFFHEIVTPPGTEGVKENSTFSSSSSSSSSSSWPFWLPPTSQPSCPSRRLQPTSTCHHPVRVAP